MKIRNVNQIELTMTSVQIAELTGKSLSHIHRDTKQMICGLFDLNIDDPNLDHKLKQYVVGVEFDERGYISLITLDEEHTLTLTTGYSVIQRNRVIKQYRLMRKALNDLAHKKDDAKAQIEAMAVMGNCLPPEERKKGVNYIIANTVVDKLVSTIFNIDKLVKKKDMTLPMLDCRNNVLDDYVALFKIGFDNSRIKTLLHEKYLNKQLVA